MIRILLLCLALGATLSACSSKSAKDQGAAVEDKSGGGAGKEGAQTYGAGEEKAGGLAALNDPDSPLSVRTVYFDYDSSDILPEYRGTVEAHAAFLAANPTVNMSLEGHADERGSREYNLALGERRAQSVKRQMVLLGASAQQISITSYGEERPAVEGHDESAWSQNRRVEFLY
ncbi:MAG: peptidoglycan-associated lipoprotein Pal [Gammaproteobacteria bacterium]|nr:peptidoglycan-associated lipoprotein Pal [Gammaproteobacteria bacterium]